MRLRPTGKNLKMEGWSGYPLFRKRNSPVLVVELSSKEVLFIHNAPAFFNQSVSQIIFEFSHLCRLNHKTLVNSPKYWQSAKNQKNLTPPIYIGIDAIESIGNQKYYCLKIYWSPRITMRQFQVKGVVSLFNSNSAISLTTAFAIVNLHLQSLVVTDQAEKEHAA